MFRVAAEEIVFFMLRHKWLNLKKREIYEYAVEVLLLNGGVLIINFLISAVCHRMDAYVAFLLIFVPLRTYLGGLHLKHSETCMILSVLFYTVVIMSDSYIYEQYSFTELICMIILSILCLVLAPLPEKTEGSGKRNKRIANGIILLDLLVVVGAYRAGYRWTPSFLLFYISVMGLFIIAKLKIWMERKEEIR